MQLFISNVIAKRKEVLIEYFRNRMPIEPKFREIVHKSEEKLLKFLCSFDTQILICKKKCFKCDRFCINS